MGDRDRPQLLIAVAGHVRYDSRVQRQIRSATAFGIPTTVASFDDELSLPQSIGVTHFHLPKSRPLQSESPVLQSRVRNFVHFVRINVVFFLLICRLRPYKVLINDPELLLAATVFCELTKLHARKCQLVYDTHEDFSSLSVQGFYASMLYKIERISIGRAFAVSTVSSSLKQVLIRNHGIEPRRVSVIWNYPYKQMQRKSSRNLREEMGSAPEDYIAVYAGVVAESRGLTTLLEAVKECQQRRVRLGILVEPGSSGAATLREEISARGVDGKVTLLDYESSDKLIDFLSQADLGVHPLLRRDKQGREIKNHSIAVPNKVFEYLNAGLRLLLSDCASLQEFASNFDHVLTFESGNAKSLAEALSQCSSMERPRKVDMFWWESQEDLIRALIS